MRTPTGKSEPTASRTDSSSSSLLAVSSASRPDSLKELPTLADAGYKNVESLAWNGLFAPAGIPKPLLNRIYADVVKVMESPAMKESLAKAFMTVVINQSPAEFQQFVLEEIKTWGKVASDNNIKVE